MLILIHCFIITTTTIVMMVVIVGIILKGEEEMVVALQHFILAILVPLVVDFQEVDSLVVVVACSEGLKWVVVES